MEFKIGGFYESSLTPCLVWMCVDLQGDTPLFSFAGWFVSGCFVIEHSLDVVVLDNLPSMRECSRAGLALIAEAIQRQARQAQLIA